MYILSIEKIRAYIADALKSRSGKLKVKVKVIVIGILLLKPSWEESEQQEEAAGDVVNSKKISCFLLSLEIDYIHRLQDPYQTYVFFYKR